LSKTKSIFSAVGVFLFVIVLWLASWYFITGYIPHKDWGQFGDMFGAVSALFSGLAFAGIIITIYLQSRELKLQRLELEQTREELRGQKEQLRKQNETMELQKFENTFFQLLKYHNEILQLFVYNDHKGSKGFLALSDVLNAYLGVLQGDNIKIDINIMIIQCNSFVKDYRDIIGGYTNNIIKILEYIDNATLTDTRFYSDLVRSHLTQPELIILFFIGLSDSSKPLYDFILKFNLFKYLDRHREILEKFTAFYPDEAYK